MPANYTDIEKALIAAVDDVDNTTPRGYPNNPLEDLPDGLWLQLHNLRADSSPATLGDLGEDNHPGILQIDVNYPVNKGSKQDLAKADELAAYFTAGKTLTYSSQEVKVVSCSLGPGRYVGGYYRVSLSVNYYARTTRN
jgi:hypothetical protein